MDFFFQSILLHFNPFPPALFFGLTQCCLLNPSSEARTHYSSQKAVGRDSPQEGLPKGWVGGQQVWDLGSCRGPVVCPALACRHTWQTLGMASSRTLSLLAADTAPKQWVGPRPPRPQGKKELWWPRLRSWASTPHLPPLQNPDAYFVSCNPFFFSLFNYTFKKFLLCYYYIQYWYF